MNFSFYGSTHLKTLRKLCELAEKHNCTISMFGDDNTDEETDIAWEEFGVTEELADKLRDIFVLDATSKFNCLTFELTDLTSKKYHKLTYFENSVSGHFDDGDITDESLEALEQSGISYYPESGFFSLDHSGDIIKGFDTCKKENCNVYRIGMIIKYFGDLVCEYLGEDYIVETY